MYKNWTLSLLCLLTLQLSGQDLGRFRDEVGEIQKRIDTIWDRQIPTVVFTGSSSVRLWDDLENRFPEKQILNTGFGGSVTKELLLFAEELIIAYRPTKVFIYEGDNDISANKSIREILRDMNDLVTRIQVKSPASEIYLISPKPSISRWHLRRKYQRLNRKLHDLAVHNQNLNFIDVWSVMLDGKQLKKDLFIEDGLHMNIKGYDLWYQKMKPYLD